MIFGKKRQPLIAGSPAEKKAYEKIQYLLNRGVEQIIPSADFLNSKLEQFAVSGDPKQKLKIYTGIDPTGPTLHIGHAICLEKLRQFQDLGHEVIMLIGGFTAQIGDPTDKTATRKKLTEEEVTENAKLYLKQAGKFLNFSGPNPVKLVDNTKWLKKMNFSDILNLGSIITVDQMLKRDMFDERVKSGKPIYLHEFMYPLMQGYDSVAMNVDVEVGGNDQLFNMLVGRDFQKKINNREKFVITMKLLADSSGKKMGKTEGNMVSFLDSAENMYGKIMSWTDGMILAGFELCTRVSDGEINKIKTDLDSGINPRDIKARLALEIVTIYYGEKSAKDAEENFEKTFQKHLLPTNIPVVKIKSGELLSKVILEQGLVNSMTEFKTLVKDGAITLNEGERLDSFSKVVTENLTVKIGKKRFLKIEIL